MAVSLTVNNTESKNPSSIDSIQAEFSTFNFTPKYVDSSEPVNISAKLEVTDGSQSWRMEMTQQRSTVIATE